MWMIFSLIGLLRIGNVVFDSRLVVGRMLSTNANGYHVMS